jgi:imidazolonepropionase-like amidohydrolase
MKRNLALFASLTATAALAAAAANAEAPRPEISRPVLLRPAQVWTADEPVHPGWVVLVEGERIAAVGPADAVRAPPDAEVIDLPGQTVTAGLMDLHSHLLLHPYNETLWDDQVLKEPIPYRTLRAGKQAQATLMAGFTTLRDLGTEGAEYADVSIKRAINEGLIPGPRLFVATRAIAAEGSYGPAIRNFRPTSTCRRARRKPAAWTRS